MRVVYVGASAEVAVPNGPEFPRGEPVEVPAKLAAALLERADFRRPDRAADRRGVARANQALRDALDEHRREAEAAERPCGCKDDDAG